MNNENHDQLEVSLPATEPPDAATVVEQTSVAENGATDNNNENVLVEALANLSNQIREVNRISEERERTINHLHEENQRLKQGEQQQLLLPVFRDLIRLYDDLRTTTANYAKAEGTEKITRELTCYGETVCDILYRHGVEQIEVSTGAVFDPKAHKAVATVPASEPELDRTIAKVVREGFKTDFRIIRNVEVEVYRHIPQEEAR